MNFIGMLRDLCRRCAACSRDFLEWFVDKPYAVRQLILKNPETLVRNEIATCITRALVTVKEYTIVESDNDVDDPTGGPHIFILGKVVKVLSEQWIYFHAHTRAWPEYFGLLLAIAKMGDVEATVLLDASYLHNCLDAITADKNMALSQQYQRLIQIVEKRSTGNRAVSYDAIIALVDRLIDVCDLTLDPIPNDELRLEYAIEGSRIPVSEVEKGLLIQFWTRTNSNIFSQKLLELHQNYVPPRNIITVLLHSLENDAQIYASIVVGFKKSINCEPFVRGALTYCEHSGTPNGIPRMIEAAASVVKETENPDGHAFLRFFREVVQLDSNRHDIPKDEILRWVREMSPHWAPPLLNHYEPFVRDGAEKYVNELLFDSQEDEPYLAPIGRTMGYSCLEHLKRTYLVQQQNAISTSLGNIERVLEACSMYIPGEEDFYARKQHLFVQLNQNTVEELDEGSEWEGSEAEDYGSSEPMDSVAEITDLNTPNDDIEAEL